MAPQFKYKYNIYRVNNKSGCTNESLANSVLLRRFACSVCLKLFDSAAQQRTHERTEHGENREEYDEISNLSEINELIV